MISVRGDGSIRLNGQSLSDEELASRMREMHWNFPDQEVILRGEADTEFERIISVLDLIKHAELWNVGFAVVRPEG